MQILSSDRDFKSVPDAFAAGSSTQYELPNSSGYCGVVNKIVLFTDGSPSDDNSANVEIESEQAV